MDNRKLPINFSDFVMHKINQESLRRENREIFIMKTIALGLAIVALVVGVVYSHYTGMIPTIEQIDNLYHQTIESVASINVIWLVAFVNATLLMLLYIYLINRINSKRSKE